MTMKERIARAICKDISGEVHDFELYIGTAEAVLDAMREPTPEMLINAGTMEGYCDDTVWGTSDKSHVDWWQAMIDAAKTEGQSE